MHPITSPWLCCWGDNTLPGPPRPQPVKKHLGLWGRCLVGNEGRGDLNPFFKRLLPLRLGLLWWFETAPSGCCISRGFGQGIGASLRLCLWGSIGLWNRVFVSISHGVCVTTGILLTSMQQPSRISPPLPTTMSDSRPPRLKMRGLQSTSPLTTLKSTTSPSDWEIPTILSWSPNPVPLDLTGSTTTYWNTSLRTY